MSSMFKPPIGKDLVKVERAEVEYGDDFVEIEGVIVPGADSWPGFIMEKGQFVARADYDVLCLVMGAWRFFGKPLIERKLTLLLPIPVIPEGEPRGVDLFIDYPIYSIRRFRVLLSTDQTRAVIEKTLPAGTPDSALLA